MNDIQTHAFPSDPAGYQPQQGLTKREYFALEMMKAITMNDELSQDWDWNESARQAIYATNALMEELAELSELEKAKE